MAVHEMLSSAHSACIPCVYLDFVLVLSICSLVFTFALFVWTKKRAGFFVWCVHFPSDIWHAMYYQYTFSHTKLIAYAMNRECVSRCFFFSSQYSLRNDGKLVLVFKWSMSYVRSYFTISTMKIPTKKYNTKYVSYSRSNELAVSFS